jgi:FKBP-type peptidyl-prolyl cis-trans isomerase
MKLNTFEAVGIGASIAVFSLALWLLRVEMTNTALTTEAGAGPDQSSLVFVSEGENQAAAVADALIEASPRGTLEQLVVDDVVVGTGDPVSSGDTVTVHYIGTLQNGQEFDNSYKREQPFTVTLGEGRVIAGWEQGLVGMQVGGKRILVIPPALGYGSAGGGPIPPNATLVFAVELIAINQ